VQNSGIRAAVAHDTYTGHQAVEHDDVNVLCLGGRVIGPAYAEDTRKNDRVLGLIREQGVQPYEGSVRFAEAAREQGLRRAVVSSSTNCEDVLVAAGIDHLFEGRIDGVVAERARLAGKPAPDTFLAGARLLGVEPSAAAVFEDALAGVEAGPAGRFGWVVGVNRSKQADALRHRGADVVVDDLAELLELR
jgi:HAD superfamily hydrolase (TIGR01509 family)